IPYLPQPVDRQTFRDTYQLPRQAVLLGPWATKDWPAMKEWVHPTTGLPNWSHLAQSYGHSTVSVMVCNGYMSTLMDPDQQDMSFANFCHMWKDDHEPERLYCKDWHFQMEFRHHDKVYSVPNVLQDDWLNAWWDHRDLKNELQDDFRFAYMGYSGSWTPLHADVFRSHSWSANICGIKRWTLFPPGQEGPLLDPSHPHLRPNGNPNDIQDYDSLPPHAILYQYPGEVVFVPSGWYHQVENLGPTISLNHNWSNASNLDIMTRTLGQDLHEVTSAIKEYRQALGPEFPHHCQTLLRANSGWNCLEYWRYLSWAASRVRT
ncbi:MAG: hypothetical protein DHS80DRAFT_7438, partial [Piptocephalis tieghemiana]